MQKNNKLKVEVQIWKDIPGYEDLYQISNLGNIRSLNYMSKKGCVRELSKLNQYQGYLAIDLCSPKTKRHMIHRLVAQTFIPNTENKPHINHIDGNKSNNNVTNLEWCTCSENHKHAFRLGLRKPTRGELCGTSKLTLSKVKEIRSKYSTGEYLQRELAEEYGVGRRHISDIVNYVNWKYEN